jgi:hypothetical protein
MLLEMDSGTMTVAGHDYFSLFLAASAVSTALK